MKSLLVLVLLSVSSYANAGAELICHSEGISKNLPTSLQETKDDIRLDLGMESHSEIFELNPEANEINTLGSHISNGEIVKNYYGKKYPQGLYTLSVPEIPGRGTLKVNFMKRNQEGEEVVTKSYTISLRCSRTDPR